MLLDSKYKKSIIIPGLNFIIIENRPVLTGLEE